MRRALLGLLLAAAACSDDGRPATTPTAPPATTASAAATTAAATPTPTRGPAVEGDVDGDGTADKATATETELAVTLSRTGRVVTAPVHSEPAVAPAVLGSADIDRDGRAELFVETAQGSSTTFVTPYRFDGTALVELQQEGGPARLGIGGAVTHGDGFACLPDGTLRVSTAESTDGDVYSVRTETLRVEGPALVRVAVRTSTGRQGDPVVDQAYTVDCGSVEPEG